MKLQPRLITAGLLAAMAVISADAAPVVQTGTYSGSGAITGTLANQNTVLYESIPIGSSTNFSAYTTSYANGGFQPNLELFDSTGLMTGYQTAMAPAGAKADPASGAILDIGYTASNLTPGVYTLVVGDWQIQQSLTATNLSSGFLNMGNGSTFVDEYGLTRTGSYNVVVSAASTATPEPGTGLLLIPAAGLIWLLRKKKQTV